MLHCADQLTLQQVQALVRVFVDVGQVCERAVDRP